MRVQNSMRNYYNNNVVNNKNNTSKKISPQQKLKLIKLQERDTHVRSHEAAHIAAGGSLVSGGPTYTYQRGPDGKLYAVGGEVKIEIPKTKNPKEMIAIAKQVRAAALAPSDPSAQDLKVASESMMMEIKAMSELIKKQAHNIYKNPETKEKNRLNITV